MKFIFKLSLGLFLLAGIKTSAQNKVIDSLNLLISNAKQDTVRIKLYIDKAAFYYKTHDSAGAATSLFEANKLAVSKKLDYWEGRTFQSLGRLYMNYGYYDVSNSYCEKGLVIAKRGKHLHMMQDLYKKMGINMMQMKRHDLTLRYMDSALITSLKNNNAKVINENFSNLAEAYSRLNRTNEAVNTYFKALERAERINDSSNIALIYANLGSLYHDIGKYEEEKSVYRKSLRFNPLKDEQDLSIKTSSLFGLGAAWHSQANFDSAAYFYSKILKNHKGNVFMPAINNYVDILLRKNQIDSAEYYADMAMKILTTTSFFASYKEVANLNKASVLISRKKFRQAIPFAETAFSIAGENNSINTMARASEALCKIYEGTGDYKKALFYNRQTKRFDDSLKSSSNKEEMLRRSMEYSFGKQQFSDSLSHADEKKQQQVQLALQQTELKGEKNLRYAMVAVLILIAAFLVFVFRAYRQKNAANKLIMLQKKETEYAYTRLHEKNQEMLDSIYYARRIQRALITNEKYIEKKLFILRNGK
ncbi:MAG: tetratricopeptide repeat protein [Bacteroidia bacterium]|nr:tetratricopeptide repeat protein [Bacteroidia bacterium]